MFTKRNNRRQFLKIASGLMAAPLGSMSTFAQSAEAIQKPFRLLTIIDHYGVPQPTRSTTWVPSSVGDYALTDDHLGTILQPLKAYRENMLIMSNTDLESHIQSGAKGTHHEFVPHTLGASATLDGSGQREPTARLLHESFDVMVGNYLSNNFSANRVYPHLFYTDYEARADPTYCYDTSGVMIRSTAGVSNAVNTVFDGISSGNEVDPVLQAQLLARQDLLGQVSARVQTLKGQFTHASYLEKIDAYDESMSSLATQLELQQAQTCSAPTETLATDRNSFESRSQMMGLIGKLFSCDLASSITYAFGGELQNSNTHRFLSADGDADVQYRLDRGLHGSSHINDDVGYKTLELVRIHQAEMVAELLDTLATTLDVDGSPILDNTVVYMPTTMATNTHQNRDYALMMLAGKNTGLQGGFHYDLGGQTNNDILVTIANGLDIPITEFGGYHEDGHKVDSLNNGPISKMLKT